MMQERQQQLRVGLHVQLDQGPQHHTQRPWLQTVDDVRQVCQQHRQQLLSVCGRAVLLLVKLLPLL
jgi:hypothetical protein